MSGDLALRIVIKADGTAAILGVRQLGDEFEKAGTRAEGSIDRLAGDLDRLLTSLDPARGKANDLANALNLLDRGARTGLVSQTQYAAAVKKLTQENEASARGFNSASMGMRTVSANLINAGQVAVVTKGSLVSMLGPLIDVGQGFAMMGGGAALGFAAVTAGLLAVVAPIAIVLGHAAGLNQQSRELTVNLKALGRQGQMTASDIRSISEAMTGQGGFGRGDTLPVAKTLASYRQFSQAALEEIGQIAVDFSASTGQELAQGTNQLVSALAQGYEGIRKLDESYQFLSSRELMQIRSMMEHGQRAEALRLTIEGLHRQFDGLAREGMSGAAQAAHNLGTAWDRMLDGLADSSVVKDALNGFSWLFNTIASWTGNTEAKLAKLQAEIADLERRKTWVRTNFAKDHLDTQIGELKAEIDRLQTLLSGGVVYSADGRLAEGYLPPKLKNDKQTDEADHKSAQQTIADTIREAQALRLSNAERERRLALVQAEIASRDKGPEAAAAERMKALTLLDARRYSQYLDSQEKSAANSNAQWDFVRSMSDGEVAGLRMRAANQAIEEARTNPQVDVAARRQSLLNEGAGNSAADLANRILQYNQQVEAIERMTEAQARGTEAAHEAERANKALADTAAFRNALEAAGVKDVDGLAAKYDELTRREAEATKTARALAKAREISPTLAYKQEIADLDELLPKLRELGATQEEIARLYEDTERRKLAASREWKDGVLSAVKEWSNEAGNAAKQFGSVTTAVLKGNEDAFVRWAQTGKVSATDLFNTVADAALRAFYKIAIYKPMEGVMESLFSGFSFFGGGSGAGVDFTPNAPVQVAHTGGMPGIDRLEQRFVDPRWFDGAPRYHGGGVGGLKPDERAVIVQVGEEILTRDDPRHRFNLGQSQTPQVYYAPQSAYMPAPQAANVNIGVQIIDQRSADQAPVQVSQERGPDGQTLLRILIPALKRDLARRGEISQALEQTFSMPRKVA